MTARLVSYLSAPVGAGLPAKARVDEKGVVQGEWRFRGQAHSHKCKVTIY